MTVGGFLRGSKRILHLSLLRHCAVGAAEWTARWDLTLACVRNLPNGTPLPGMCAGGNQRLISTGSRHLLHSMARGCAAAARE
jgi:hypothetical protein